MFEKFDIDDRNIFKVCVIATMSSGKSTFINSIIGEEIMPEKNEACTARTMAVLDNDSIKTKLAHIIRKNGDKEIVEINSRDVLDRVNNDEDVADFVVETDIQSITNTNKALMLVDTPGVNNSEDERHGQRTEEFLQQLETGVVIYLMNATQLATNDDSILLKLVSEHVKKRKGNVKIFFVINKIDALDTETESIAGTVAIAKDYIENHGIKNPIIYPMSALAAKTLRMALYRREMTRRELRKLEDIYENYQSKDNNMMAYAMSDELSGEMYEIGDNSVSAQELQRAIDNTGITAVEKRIQSYMRELEQHFSPEIVIKTSMSESVAQKYQDRLNALVSIPSKCSLKKFNDLVSDLDKDKLMSGLNYALGALEESDAVLDIVPDISITNEQFDLLVANIESTKKKFFTYYTQEKAIAAKHKRGVYFFPTSVDKEKINAKLFFYTSADGTQWKMAKFGEISKFIEENKEFYLFNAYESFIFKVNKENANDIIPLLDTRLPIRLTRIAKLSNEIPSIDEVYEHIMLLANADAVHQREVYEAEGKLKRTYKGVLFNSEKEKNDAIKLEKEVEEFCNNLNEHSFEEIYAYKQKVANYPNVIFASYITKLVSGLDIQENREKNEFLDRIEIAQLEDTSSISEEIKNHNYSETTIHLLEKNINLRKLKCQRVILDSHISNISSMNRSELDTLKTSIGKLNFDSALVGEYEETIQRQYDAREVQELRELCADIDQRNISELNELEKKIKKERYQDKHTSQYFSIIDSRIEHLHIQNIEQICSNVESVDRETLRTIRKKVEDENCRSELKQNYFNRIDKREEVLDYEDLCDLTAGLERKNVNELNDLLYDLSSGKYNEKYIKTFQLRTRVALERAQYEYLSAMIQNLNQMNKAEIQKISDLIKRDKYTERVVSLINARIEERIYILDMYELMNYKNEFDNLSLSDIDSLRRYIKEKNVCQRSKDTYSKKLNTRETVIGYEKVSPLASFLKQNVDQMGIGRFLNIKLATFSEDYMLYLEKHFEMLGKRNFENIPVAILPDCASFAINKASFFCRTSNGYKEYGLDSIQSITVEKKLFSEYVLITLKNGSTVSLTAGINKNNSSLLMNMILLLAQNVSNEAMLSRYQPYADRIYPLREEDFEKRIVPNDVDIQVILFILSNRMKEISATVKMPSIRYVGIDNWASTEAKVLAGFGINSEQHLALYYDRTLFNTAKDGVAFGEKFAHIKSANQNLISIPYEDIWDVDYSGNVIKIQTLKNGDFTSEFTMPNPSDGKIIAECLSEYVKGVQFISGGMIKSVDNISNSMQQPENKCPACNASLKIGAKFCSQCGKKMGESINAVQEYCFCSNCGNKIIKGKKFCSSCGSKVD